MKLLRVALLGLLPSTLLLAACGDPLRPRAHFEVRTDSMIVWAMTGTPIALPSAVNLQSLTAVRTDVGAGFDLAFDLSDGEILVYPIRSVLSGPIQLTGAHRVALRRMEEPFDSVLAAPRGGYTADSVMVVAPGETVVAEVQSPSLCQFQASPFVYAKFYVDEVNLENRTLRVIATVDPNCGFRSFEPGVPSS